MVFSKTLTLSVLAAFAPSAFANLFLTSPVASTTCTANQDCQVSWNDDGKAPPLASFGVCTVGLYVGSVNTQILLQDFAPVDVSQAASFSFKPQPAVGPNANVYFVRFSSVNGKDATNNNFPYQGFSAKFTLAGMTGTFNSTVQSIISGAPAGSTPAGGSSTTPSTSPTSTTPSSNNSSTKKSSTASASATGTSGAASARASFGSTQAFLGVGLAGLVTVVAGLMM